MFHRMAAFSGTRAALLEREKRSRQKAVSVSQITQSFFVFLRHNSSHDNKTIFS
jgi:hypothetical protein